MDHPAGNLLNIKAYLRATTERVSSKSAVAVACLLVVTLCARSDNGLAKAQVCLKRTETAQDLHVLVVMICSWIDLPLVYSINPSPAGW